MSWVLTTAASLTLLYTWSATSGPAAVTFSDNGDNSARNATATFTSAGTYVLQATITDAGGLSATSSVSVTVNQTLTDIQLTPAGTVLNQNQTTQFTATGYDQFGDILLPQPAFTWSSSGIGSVNAAGLYTAPGSGTTGSATVTAVSGSVTGTAPVTVTNAAPTVATAASASPSSASGTSTALSVLVLMTVGKATSLTPGRRPAHPPPP